MSWTQPFPSFCNCHRARHSVWWPAIWRVSAQRCDGAHSPIRHALGVSFPGDDYPTDFMTADVPVDWKLPRDQHAFFFAAEGMLAFFPLPRGRATIAADTGPTQGDHPPLGEPALEDL